MRVEVIELSKQSRTLVLVSALALAKPFSVEDASDLDQGRYVVLGQLAFREPNPRGQSNNGIVQRRTCFLHFEQFCLRFKRKRPPNPS